MIVMTPQIILNSISSGDVDSLGLFTLLIFDECHHTVKNDPYNRIMGHYIDEKFEAERTRKSVDLPQVSVSFHDVELCIFDMMMMMHLSEHCEWWRYFSCLLLTMLLKPLECCGVFAF